MLFKKLSLCFPGFSSFSGVGRGFSLLLKPVEAAWSGDVGRSHRSVTLSFLLKATETGFVFLVSDAINSHSVTFPLGSPKPAGLAPVSHGSQAGFKPHNGPAAFPLSSCCAGQTWPCPCAHCRPFPRRPHPPGSAAAL